MPSRSRPDRLRHTLTEALRLARGETDFAIGVDLDDQASYEPLLKEFPGDRVRWHRQPRATFTSWTNFLALTHVPRYRAIGSFGDDHVPLTEGWDTELSGALARMGGGFAYADDMWHGERLPTAFMVSSEVIRELRWLACPCMSHYFIDQVIYDLAEDTGRRAYCRDVKIRHDHHLWNTASFDLTYAQAFTANWHADRRAYEQWYRGQRAGDAETVRRALGIPVPA